MSRQFYLGVALCLATSFARPGIAGTFRITRVDYTPTLTDSSLLNVVTTQALYLGTSDSNDNNALIQTVAHDNSPTGDTGGGGAGMNYQGPFFTNQVITCAGSCSGRKYTQRKLCGHAPFS
jgi:hypothetical protein